MSRFSDNLKRFRKQNHMTQTQLAEKIGVGRSAVSMYEMGEREPDFETLEAIADIFNVDMAVLLGTETKKSPTTEGEGITDEQLKFALFGDVAPEISDAQLNDVKRYAKFIIDRE